MKTHIVLAHPEAKSFNGHLAETTQKSLSAQGWDCTYSDLYGQNFDPREAPEHFTSRSDTARFHAQTEQRFNATNGTIPDDVAQEIDNLRACDLLVLHFPVWWFGMPAILKGWIDRVFVYGEMYRSTVRYDTGVCVGKRMIACVTTGATAESCAYDGREGDTKLHLWPALFPFRYIGFDVLHPEIFHGIGGVAFMEGDEGGTNAAGQYTQQWEATLGEINDRPVIPYNSDADFGEDKRLKVSAPSHSPFVAHSSNAPWG